jgi:hypothetical protein
VHLIHHSAAAILIACRSAGAFAQLAQASVAAPVAAHAYHLEADVTRLMKTFDVGPGRGARIARYGLTNLSVMRSLSPIAM